MSGTQECFICKKQIGEEEPPPGGYIYKGRHFAICHPPLNMVTSAGTMLVESRRHFLDFGEMREVEGADLFRLLRKLFTAMKEATEAERVYSLATMDGVPHFHLWLVPWKKGERHRGVRYLASKPSEPPSLNEALSKVRTIKRNFRA